MTWIKLHQSIRDHRKVVKAAGLLRINETQMIGHLGLLWIWAIENSRHGLLEHDARMIARACRWDKAPDRLLEVLLEVRVLDLDSDGNLRVVNYDEHIGPIVKAAASHRARQAEYRRRLTDLRDQADRDRETAH